MKKNIGTVYTFYSYKGGVGRSMALANVATLLAKWGHKVLILDWDLEAPGIERYFVGEKLKFTSKPENKYGIVDLVDGYVSSNKISWKDCVINVHSSVLKRDISVITAGDRSTNYVKKLQDIVWTDIFNESDFGTYLEEIRSEWIAEYDYVLIDSRTGITDIGGICTIHLPDILVLMFTTNEQSLNGVCEVMDLAREKHKNLPFDRNYLLGLPVPSRDESRTEYENAQKWKERFSTQLGEIYRDWIPKNISPLEVIEKLRIPNIPYWSFGEKLPVIEEGTDDPAGIGFAIETLARLITHKLDWNKTSDKNQSVSSDSFDQNKLEENMVDSHFMKAQDYVETRLEDQIHWYSAKSSKNQSRFKYFTFLQLICSLSIPILATNNFFKFLPIQSPEMVNNITISILGLFVAFCTGILSLNKYQENWINYRTTAEDLKKEKFMFVTQSPPYNYSDDSFQVLVQRVESLISKENTGWGSIQKGSISSNTKKIS